MILAEHHELVLAAVSADGDYCVVDVGLELAIIEEALNPRIAKVLLAAVELGLVLWGQLSRYESPTRARLVA